MSTTSSSRTASSNTASSNTGSLNTASSNTVSLNTASSNTSSFNTSSSNTSSRAPVLLRPRNFQWYWNSAANPRLTEGDENWQKYMDVENEIIEDAHNEKKFDVEIDGNYIVNFERQVQYKKDDKYKECPIKRVYLHTSRSNVHLREERFSILLPVTLAPTSSSNFDPKVRGALIHLRENGNFLTPYYEMELWFTSKTIDDVVEDAAQGILQEGTSLGKVHEAEWIAKQLRAVKHFGTEKKAKSDSKIPSEIGETCVYLYTKESFWYKLLNNVFRNPQTVTVEQLKTLGPFAYLLYYHLKQNGIEEDSITVYRGMTLTDEQRQEFMEEEMRFSSFTSTSRNRALAEQFGNTLLIIDLNVKSGIYGDDSNIPVGVNISHLSDFPNEEEYLLWPGLNFHFVKYDYDNVKKKHIILCKAESSSLQTNGVRRHRFQSPKRVPWRDGSARFGLDRTGSDQLEESF